jgi:hypothetical protein
MAGRKINVTQTGIPNLSGFIAGGTNAPAPAPAPLPPSARGPAIFTAPTPPPPTAIGAASLGTTPFGTLGSAGMSFLGSNLYVPPAPTGPAPPSAIFNIGQGAAPPAAGGNIPINAPGPPSITLGQGISAVQAAPSDTGAASFITSTVASAQSGNPTGQANAAVLTIAQRLTVMASFVARFVGAAQAQDILTGVHLTQ